jgi:hypothetical protein
MRRPRAGDERSSCTRAAPGLRPGSLGTPARSWLTAAGSPGRVGFAAWLPSGGRRLKSRKTLAQESGTESAARRCKEDAAMERREARTRRHGCPRRKAWIAKDAPLGAPSPRFIRGGEGLPAEARKAKAGTTAYPAPLKNRGDVARVLFIPPLKGEGGERSSPGGVCSPYSRSRPPPAAFGGRPPPQAGER